MSDLSDIPVPPAGAADAWHRAQEAMQKFGSASTPKPPQPPQQKKPPPTPTAQQQAALAQYPWMVGALGMQYGPPTQSLYSTPNSFSNGYGSPWAQYQPPPPPPPSQTQQQWGGYQQQQRTKYQPYQKNQHQQQQKSSFLPFKIGDQQGAATQPKKPAYLNNFVPASSNTLSTGTAVHKLGQRTNPAALKGVPESAVRYMERARLAVDQKDYDKVTAYLKKRLDPLIQSGAVVRVDWDREPLPHEVNFQIKTGWTPAAQLRHTPTQLGKGLANAPQRAPSPRNAARKRMSSSGSPEGDVNKNAKKTKREKKLERQKYQEELRKAQKASNASKQQSNKTKGLKEKWALELSDSKKDERAKRFASWQPPTPTTSTLHTHRHSRQIVRGTCQTVEKSYFRLTTAPDPSQVRPLDVLQKALEMVKKKYKNGADYRYLIGQLKSIRQDLTVQRIRNWFTVLVYETNARVCLENKDREEFNQCQNQLRALYSEVSDCPNESEFVAYRLLYYIYMNNSTDILTLLRSISEQQYSGDCIRFAVEVREAVANGLYTRLFRLYEKAPKMSSYLFDMFAERERKNALTACVKAYRPSLKLSVFANWVGLEEQAAVDWLKTLEIECTVGGQLDCKSLATKSF